MSSMNIISIANDLLQIFERTLNFLQSIGILEAYTFNHSNIFFSPVAEKYLENFIALLEEIKDVLNRLQDVQNQPKSVERKTTNPAGTLVSNDLITASQLIQTAEIYVSEQLLTPQVELGQLTTPQALLNNDINEPATESSWVPPEEKDIEEEKENEIFQCSVCNKILSSKTVLKLHQSTHTGQKLFCCEHCGKLFTTNLNLSAHLTRQHNLNTELANSCKECGKLFVRKSALDTHLKSHLSIKPWECNVCSKTFTQKVTRDTHQLTHTRDYRFTCDTCGRTFPSKAKLNYHSKTHGDPQFSCHLCDKRFSTRQYLTAHFRTHDLRQPPPQAPCRLDTVSTQLVEETVNVFKCSHCARSFPSQHSLSLHSQKHNPINRYNLDKRKMAARQKHGCNVCGKEFLLKTSLMHHQRQQHSASGQRPRPYSCQLCHQTFTLRAKARLHMQIHTQQMQHVCGICGKGFRRQDSLKRHLPLHSRETSSSGTAARLTMPTYKCDQCDKAYRSRAALSFHAETHQGKFKFQCNMCGKQFVRKCHYRGHLLTHSTDRPYKCDTCGKGFKDNKTCREHSKRVHAHAHTQPPPLVHSNGEPISAPEVVGELMSQDNEMAASQMAIHTLLAGDDATYGQTYDQFQACVQLQ